MYDVFKTVLQYSIQAGLLVLALVILRLILRKAPRSLICALWALVAVRLIFPFRIESIFSVVPDTEIAARAVGSFAAERITSAVWEYPETFLHTTDNMVIEEKTDMLWNTLPRIAAYVWLAGVIVMAVYAAVSYLRLRRMTRESVEIEKGVFLCDRIPSPFILGIIRPKIFLPSDISEHDKPYVLAHERAHIRRRDHLWKPLGFLLLSVYWFNPLLWAAYVFLCRDIELACDEKVIRELGHEAKKPYAIALINSAAPRKLISACPLAFGETGVKSRIKNVLNYKKPAFWIIIVAVVLSIAVAVCFLTNPIDKNETDLIGEASVSPAEPSLETLEPNNAVNRFFMLNYDKFPESEGGWDSVKERYYGGTHLDGGTQVILLIDISGVDSFKPASRNIGYEKCDYSYKELTDAINNAAAYLGQDEGYGKDIIGITLADDKNRIFVSIYDISDEKIKWFKETVSDKDYFVFRNTDILPQDLDSLTVKTDLPTITYADDQYIYLDGDCGIVIYDYKNAKLINRIPVSRLRQLGYTVPYSRVSEDGKRITIRNYTGEDDIIFPFIELDPATGEVIAVTSTGEIPVTDGGLSDISDKTFEFDYYNYDIKYDENGKNISERIYRKGDTEYRLSAPGWLIKNTTVWIKRAGSPIGFGYHIFEETTLDGKNVFLD